MSIVTSARIEKTGSQAALRSVPAKVRFISAEPLLESLADINLDDYHWLIAGGESGSGFRPMREEWALELREICARDGVGFHFKQHSAFKPGQGAELCGKMHHEPPLVQIGLPARIAKGA